MKYAYVVMKDEKTNQVEVLGRFRNGVGEVFLNGNWETAWQLNSLMFDGLLEDVSEAEALEITAKQLTPELQAA